MAMRRMTTESGNVGVGIADDDGEWETLTVTWGAEKFSPVQYQNFDVGPLAVTIAREPGLSVEDAHARAMTRLRELVQVQFEEQLRDFLARVKQAATVARGGR